MFRNEQSERSREHELAHPLRLLDRERGRDQPAERVPHEGHLAKPESVEEIEIVQDVVLGAVDSRVVG